MTDRLVRVDALPDDLRAIVVAAVDLARYRELDPEAARDLQTAVAHELVDRASKLPEHKP